MARFGPARPTGLTISVGPHASVPIPDGWSAHSIGGDVRMWWQRVTVSGLAPGQRYTLRLVDGDAEVATATAVTLPDHLPTLDEQPLTCLLGSCFGFEGDPFGRAIGAAIRQLPAPHKPDVTLLCGDQVYLDAPFPRYLHHAPGGEELRLELYEKYRANWAQPDIAEGYAEVLRHGATYFSADDHELWNNAPNKTPVVLKTWFGPWRDEWFAAASELYDRFQSSRRVLDFAIGQLSFLVADLRLDRTADRARLQTPADHARVIDWLAALDGPGVLVLGQPMLSSAAGWKGNLTDWGLPDYQQYGPLVAAIQRAEHDIVVMTGDVHFGRIAGAALPSGATLYEVIASPFALVSSLLPQSWSAPPGRFPAHPIAGTVGSPVWYDEYRVEVDHFATVAFASSGGHVRMDVTAWPVPALGGALLAGPRWQGYLQ